MNPWEMNLTVEEIPQDEKPWERNMTEGVKRGTNFAGALRNIAQATPFIGPWADEIEGYLRAGEGGKDYETWRRNAEESALGNIENTSYGKTLEIGTNLAENAALAYALKGKTLTPGVSALQGAIEGAGRGDDTGSRFANAVVGGGLGFVIPTTLNKILPTKTVQQEVLKNAAKGKDALQSITAKALLQNTTPEDVIAREVPRGMRPNLWANIRRSSSGENVFRPQILEQASETYSKPYTEYITEEIGSVVPKHANKLGKEIEKLNLDQLGEDIVGEIDPRKIVMEAVNKTMKNATAEEQNLAMDALENAIAKRGVAKKLTNIAIERPITSPSFSLGTLLQKGKAPLMNLSNAGTLRTMTVGTPNYQSTALENLIKNKLGTSKDIFNFYTPDVVRGGLDALLEDYERKTLK